MAKKITYLLGAGASYQACPVWREQAEKMVEFGITYSKFKQVELGTSKESDLKGMEKVLYDIHYFGNKGLEYGTVDTYAKKLNLSNDHECELQKLKIAISVFFTLWESGNFPQKKLEKRNVEDVDKRYIALLASLLQSENDIPKLKSHVKFVTWNYDLQLERAFKQFCNNELKFKEISENLSFRVSANVNKQLEVCHLNGYNGFYYTNNTFNNENEEHDFLDRTTSKEINEILKAIEFIGESASRESINPYSHINFAWENNDLASKTRSEAQRIFRETDVLVIIGYSFPAFNKEIDALLFKEIKGRNVKIIYQDPNARRDFLELLVDKDKNPITIKKDKIDQFILPYELE